MYYFNKLNSNLNYPIQQDKLEIILNNNSRELCKNELVFIVPSQFTFIKYTMMNSTSIYFEVPTILINKEPCSYKFILINIYIPEIDFRNNIDFKGYYLVGNKINNNIICYLLQMQYNINAINKKYTLTIIDQNVKIINIDETRLITLDLNNYIIT